MTRLSNGNQVITALAIDQRGALKRLLAAAAGDCVIIMTGA